MPTEAVKGVPASTFPIAYFVAMAAGPTPPADCTGGKFTSDSSYVWKGLTPGSAYTFRVCTVEVNGAGTTESDLSSGIIGTATTSTLPVTSLLKLDATTQGSWIGTYGSLGSEINADTASLPAFATVNISGSASYTWASGSADVRALQNPGGVSRIASCWYSGSSFTVDIKLTDGLTHNLELYFLDWDNLGRGEQVQVSSADTGDLLDSEMVTSFSGGTYLNWAVSGHVVLTFTNMTGPNAVLSGIFFDPAS